jgi:hypothetical protein
MLATCCLFRQAHVTHAIRVQAQATWRHHAEGWRRQHRHSGAWRGGIQLRQGALHQVHMMQAKVLSVSAISCSAPPQGITADGTTSRALILLSEALPRHCRLHLHLWRHKEPWCGGR